MCRPNDYPPYDPESEPDLAAVSDAIDARDLATRAERANEWQMGQDNGYALARAESAGTLDAAFVQAAFAAERDNPSLSAEDIILARLAEDADDRGTGPDRYPTILRDDRGRPVDVG